MYKNVIKSLHAFALHIKCYERYIVTCGVFFLQWIVTFRILFFGRVGAFVKYKSLFSVYSFLRFDYHFWAYKIKPYWLCPNHNPDYQDFKQVIME